MAVTKVLVCSAFWNENFCVVVVVVVVFNIMH